MRAVMQREQKQRGCVFCADAVEMMQARKSGLIRPDDANKGEHCIGCPYAECPYHELDGISNYVTEWDRIIAARLKMPY